MNNNIKNIELENIKKDIIDLGYTDIKIIKEEKYISARNSFSQIVGSDICNIQSLKKHFKKWEEYKG